MIRRTGGVEDAILLGKLQKLSARETSGIVTNYAVRKSLYGEGDSQLLDNVTVEVEGTSYTSTHFE